MSKPTSKVHDHIAGSLGKLKNLSYGHAAEVLDAAGHPSVDAIAATVAKIKADPRKAAPHLAELATRWDMTMAVVTGVHDYIDSELTPLGIPVVSLADGFAAAAKKLA